MHRRSALAAAVLAVLVFAGCSGGTDGPSKVTATSARLNAHGKADKGAAYSYFQYGRTTGYGSKTVTHTWPSGTSSTFYEPVSGLLPSTVYHYRVCGGDVGKSAACAQDVWFTTSAQGTDPKIAAAGNIACSPSDPNFKGGAGTATVCRQKATSDLLVGKGYSTVLALGDNQYDCAAASDFAFSFNPAWGRVKSLIRSVPGNHEYKSANPDIFHNYICRPGAAGYFGYFGAAAGFPPGGYYSFNLGSWHIVALNSGLTGSSDSENSCGSVVGCGPGSPQDRWLRADLAANPRKCTLAFWHAPIFASSSVRSSAMRTLWDDLQNAGADVVLNAHAHGYERFKAQTSTGVASTAFGMREFIVGTGGKALENFAQRAANSEKIGSTFGVLQLTLLDSAYTWQFVPEAGKTFTDSGGGFCR